MTIKEYLPGTPFAGKIGAVVNLLDPDAIPVNPITSN
jgi:hypothetical protein